MVNFQNIGQQLRATMTGSFQGARQLMADFDCPTRVTRVTLTSYPVYAAHAVSESNPTEERGW